LAHRKGMDQVGGATGTMRTQTDAVGDHGTSVSIRVLIEQEQTACPTVQARHHRLAITSCSGQAM
jgi:hypothetical protein